MLIFKFTVAAVIRLSNHYIGLIRDILNGRGGVMFPGGVYPKIDALLSASPIRYEVIYNICALNMATNELFGAYEMYHFRSDFRRSDGRVCIDEGHGSSFYNELEYYMCGIFGFQGYNQSGEEDPYMKPNVTAPLFGVEPGSSVHVDYILNRRGGKYNKALIAVFGTEFCSKFFDPMRPVRDHWSKIAKQMQSMGDADSKSYSENDEDIFNIFSDDADDELQLEEGGDCDSFDSSYWSDDYDDYDEDDDDDVDEDDDEDDDDYYHDDDHHHDNDDDDHHHDHDDDDHHHDHDEQKPLEK
jgi:hypothetical protein